MHHNKAVFKIGGKILENSKNLEFTISQLKKLYEDNTLQKIIIIPGGGSYANFIRNIDKKLILGDDLAHWTAIFSMDYNGKDLNRKFPDFECIDDFEIIQRAKRIFCIFLPYKYLRKKDELPHSWDGTSDSIAIYIANKLNLNKCYLIKDIEGIYNNNNEVIKEISTIQYRELKKSGRLAEIGLNQDNLKKSKPIDPYLLTLIDKYKISCILLNGTLQNSRIINYFKNIELENQVYTKIKFS
ncbi:MAG: amino acid kinase family protein [Promethearchaeota archaeon]